MKSTGIVRRIDDLGRVVIPKETRKVLSWNKGDSMEFYTVGDKVIIRKYERSCTFCGSMDNLTEFGGQKVCGNCRDEIRRGL